MPITAPRPGDARQTINFTKKSARVRRFLLQRVSSTIYRPNLVGVPLRNSPSVVPTVTAIVLTPNAPPLPTVRSLPSLSKLTFDLCTMCGLFVDVLHRLPGQWRFYSAQGKRPVETLIKEATVCASRLDESRAPPRGRPTRPPRRNKASCGATKGF
jgi:hypothetical protein